LDQAQKEISNAESELNSARQSVETFLNQITAKEEQYSHLEAKVSFIILSHWFLLTFFLQFTELHSDWNKLSTELEASEQELGGILERLKAAEEEAARHEQERVLLGQQIVDLQSHSSESVEEMQNLRAQINSKEMVIESLAVLHRTLLGEKSDRELTIQNISTELNQKQESFLEVQSLLEQSRIEHASTTALLDDVQFQYENLKEDYEALEEQRSEIQGEIELERIARMELEQQYNDAKELVQTRDHEIIRLGQELESIKEVFGALQQQVDDSTDLQNAKKEVMRF
jgi:chromosome segregation ATPase